MILERIKIQELFKNKLPPEIIRIIENYYFIINFNLVVKKIKNIKINKNDLYFINLDYLNISMKFYRCILCDKDYDEIKKCRLCDEEICYKCYHEKLFNGVCESCISILYDLVLESRIIS